MTKIRDFGNDLTFRQPLQENYKSIRNVKKFLFLKKWLYFIIKIFKIYLKSYIP